MNLNIKEAKGNSHVFTLKDGSTFRIFPYESKTIKKSLVSEDIKQAEKLGLVITSTPVVSKVQTKKSGGKK